MRVRKHDLKNRLRGENPSLCIARSHCVSPGGFESAFPAVTFCGCEIISVTLTVLSEHVKT